MVQSMDVVEQLFLASLGGLRLGVDTIVATGVALHHFGNVMILLALGPEGFLGADQLLFFFGFLGLDGRNDLWNFRHGYPGLVGVWLDVLEYTGATHSDCDTPIEKQVGSGLCNLYRQKN